MSRTHRSCRRDHLFLPGLALAALLIIAFTLSILTNRRAEAQSEAARQAREQSSHRSITNLRATDVENLTDGAGGRVMVVREQ